MQGSGSSTAPTVRLDQELPAGWATFNKGVSGESAHQIAERVIADSATMCGGEACGVYWLQGGVNTLKSAAFMANTADEVANIALNGDGGADDQHDLGMLDAADYLLSIYPDVYVLLSDALPYAAYCEPGQCPTVTIAAHARATAYNSLLAAACAARPRLRCIFNYSAFTEPATSGHLRTAYTADSLHLNQTGTDALVETVLPQIP
jgi:hypothetical protein